MSVLIPQQAENREVACQEELHYASFHLFDLHQIVGVLPNGSRLSCGALKKDSFPNLRAPSASSACYAGAQLISNSLSSPLRRPHLGDFRTRCASAPHALPGTRLRTNQAIEPATRALLILELALPHHPKILPYVV